MKSVYRKFTDQIAADAARSGAAIPPPSVFAWLSGVWIWQGLPVRFDTAEYGISRNGEPFLIHHAAADMWVLALTDPGAFGMLIGLGLRNGQGRFTGDVTVGELPVRLRQTWIVRNDNEIEITSEHRNGDAWQLWDVSLLARVKPLN